MSIEPYPQRGEKVREDLNVYRLAPIVLGGARLSRGACYYPVHPVHPVHPASDAIDIKVLSDLVILFPDDAIDMQVLTDLKTGSSVGAVFNRADAGARLKSAPTVPRVSSSVVAVFRRADAPCALEKRAYGRGWGLRTGCVKGPLGP